MIFFEVQVTECGRAAFEPRSAGSVCSSPTLPVQNVPSVLIAPCLAAVNSPVCNFQSNQISLVCLHRGMKQQSAQEGWPQTPSTEVSISTEPSPHHTQYYMSTPSWPHGSLTNRYRKTPSDTSGYQWVPMETTAISTPKAMPLSQAKSYSKSWHPKLPL